MANFNLSDLFATYTPPAYLTMASQASSSKSSKSSSDDVLKDFRNMLKELEGLPNEMEVIAAKLSKMNNMLNSPIQSEMSLKQWNNFYVSALLEVKKAKYNKEMFKETFDQVKANGGLSEIAIDPISGQVWVLKATGEDAGKPVMLTVDKYLQNKEDYVPITNSLLLYMRSHYASFVNNNLILQTIENGIGTDKLVSMIKDRFRSIGQDSAETKYMYLQTAEGVKQLEKLSNSPNPMPLEGLYDVHNVDKTSKRLIESALRFIYSTLPENAKSLLKIKGGSYEKAILLIGDYIVMGTGETHERSYTYSSANKEGSDGEGSFSKMHLSVPYRWLSGAGNKTSFTINPGTTMFIDVDATSMLLVGKNSKDPIEIGLSMKDVSGGAYASVLDFNNVSFGGTHVTNAYLNRIAIEDNEIYLIDYPYTTDDNNHIVPDLQLGRKKTEVDRALIAKGINPHDPKDRKKYRKLINLFYKSNNLPILLDLNGEIITSNYMLFGVITGVTDAVKSAYSQLIDDDEEEKQYIETFTANVGKDYKLKKSFLGIGTNNEYRRGSVFIPVIANLQNAQFSELLTPALFMELETKATEAQLEETLQTRYINAKQFE